MYSIARLHSSMVIFVVAFVFCLLRFIHKNQIELTIAAENCTHIHTHLFIHPYSTIHQFPLAIITCLRCNLNFNITYNCTLLWRASMMHCRSAMLLLLFSCAVCNKMRSHCRSPQLFMRYQLIWNFHGQSKTWENEMLPINQYVCAVYNFPFQFHEEKLFFCIVFVVALSTLYTNSKSMLRQVFN